MIVFLISSPEHNMQRKGYIYLCSYVIFRIKMFYIRSLFILSSVLKSWFSYIWEVCFESLCMTMTSSIFREHLTSVNINGGILRTKSMISILWFCISISVRKVMQKYSLTVKHGINLITFCQVYKHPQHLTISHMTVIIMW